MAFYGGVHELSYTVIFILLPTIKTGQIREWQTGKEGNIRALLGSLHTVLWEGAKYKPPGIIIEAKDIKRGYIQVR